VSVGMSAVKLFVVNVDIRALDGLCLCLIMIKFGGKVAAVRIGREEPTTNLPPDS
jgi:hypothetical protein